MEDERVICSSARTFAAGMFWSACAGWRGNRYLWVHVPWVYSGKCRHVSATPQRPPQANGATLRRGLHRGSCGGASLLPFLDRYLTASSYIRTTRPLSSSPVSLQPFLQHKQTFRRLSKWIASRRLVVQKVPCYPAMAT